MPLTARMNQSLMVIISYSSGTLVLVPDTRVPKLSEGADRDRKLVGESDTTVWGGAACSGDEVGGSSHCRARIALDTAPIWRASYHGVATATSMLF